MKKIFLTFTFTALTCLAIAQTERSVKTNKWYMTETFAPKNMTLSKAVPIVNEINVAFNDNGAMNYCFLIHTTYTDVQGNQIAAGTYQCDAVLYTYEIKNDMLHVKFPLYNYYYKITTLANGDLDLVYVNENSAVKSNPPSKKSGN